MADDSPSRRLIDLSIIAPVIGFFLLIPPILGLFATDDSFYGAPAILVYLFSVWLVLIVGAAILSRKLAGPGEKTES